MRAAHLFIFILILIFLLPVTLTALDFGLTANIYDGFGNIGIDENDAGDEKIKNEFRADIIPRVSFLIGDNADFLLTAGITLGNNEEFYWVPELLRTEFTINFGNMAVKAGRINYSDPLSFIAAGLFDGLLFSHNSASGNISIGAYYTGLLYKKTANITMTQGDEFIYESALDYNDFANTYFAPARLIASAGWEHPSIAEFLRLNAAILAQFDLTDDSKFDDTADDKFHSQYFIVKAGIPVNNFLFELGGSIEISQIAYNDDERNFISFAGDLGIFWILPGSVNSRLSFDVKIAGGRVDDSVGAFTPVSTKYYGNIFRQKMSSLSVLTLSYMARLAEPFSISLSALHFVRNDLGTYTGFPADPEKEGYSLGTEIFARMIWSAASDLQFNIGGGAFVPALGDAGPKENPWWRVELSAVLALL